MKAKPLRLIATDPREYQPCSAAEATHLRLMIPGPISNRIIAVTMGEKQMSPQWKWNGDTEKPTLQSSMLTCDGMHTCHSFVIDGVVQFLSDCTHELRGRSVELLDVDWSGSRQAILDNCETFLTQQAEPATLTT